MTVDGFDQLLWAAGFCGSVALLVVLLVRHRARLFPWFTVFSAAVTCRTIILFLLFRTHPAVHTYFVAYWTLAILVDVVLQSAVVYEVASQVFRPLGYWAPDARRGATILAIGSLLVAAIVTYLATPVSSLWQESVVSKGQFFLTTLMGELFLGMVTLSMTIGLPWRTHTARIAQGLGVYSLTGIALQIGHTLYGAGFHAQIDFVLSDVSKVVYLGCLVYWVVTLWRQAPEPRTLSEQARKQLHALEARLAYDLHTLRSGRRP